MTWKTFLCEPTMYAFKELFRGIFPLQWLPLWLFIQDNVAQWATEHQLHFNHAASICTPKFAKTTTSFPSKFYLRARGNMISSHMDYLDSNSSND